MKERKKEIENSNEQKRKWPDLQPPMNGPHQLLDG